MDTPNNSTMIANCRALVADLSRKKSVSYAYWRIGTWLLLSWFGDKPLMVYVLKIEKVHWARASATNIEYVCQWVPWSNPLLQLYPSTGGLLFSKTENEAMDIQCFIQEIQVTWIPQMP